MHVDVVSSCDLFIWTCYVVYPRLSAFLLYGIGSDVEKKKCLPCFLRIPHGRSQVQAAAHATQDMQRKMFGTALDMAMRQVANTLKTLENDRKTCARPDFKPSPV